jgi:phosphoketolase
MIDPLVRRLLTVNRESLSLRAGLYEIGQNDPSTAPKVLLAAADDIPTLEIVAAAWWLRQHVPDLKVRVVNVVALMTLFPPRVHPHGMEEASFVQLYTSAGVSARYAGGAQLGLDYKLDACREWAGVRAIRFA